jgi:hypothetical protein
MVGPTLVEIREHVEQLATPDGRYHVVCGYTGARPVPVAGHRFEDRATARVAARATEQYRAALRRYDPQVPLYNLIVCQDPPRGATSARSDGRDGWRESPEDVPVGDASRDGSDSTDRREVVEFCHRLASAVFESLSGGDHDAVERAVMDAYFELAETVDDPDRLCFPLLESMATELDARLCPSEQAAVLTDAAGRLDPTDAGSEPLPATLDALDARGLVDGYRRSPWSVDLDGGGRSVAARVFGYALSPRDGRLPVLPFTLELLRRRPTRLPKPVEVAAVDGGWRVTFVLDDGVDRDGLLCVPVATGV